MTRTLMLLMIVPFAFGCAVDYEPPRPATASKKKSNSALKASAAAPVAVVADSVVAPPAQMHRIETPPPLKPSKPVPMIRLEGIRSDHPQPSTEKALNDAINTSRGELMKKLQSLDPPCYAKPSLARIRGEYLKKDSVREVKPTTSVQEEWKAKGLDPNLIWVDIDLELTERQVQSLRSSERVNEGLGGAALVLALMAAAYGFLRLDAWTKGYLTLWLGIGALAIVAVAVLCILA